MQRNDEIGPYIPGGKIVFKSQKPVDQIKEPDSPGDQNDPAQQAQAHRAVGRAIVEGRSKRVHDWVSFALKSII